MIENKTRYSEELLKEYIKFSTKRNRMITLVCSIIILISSIFEIIMDELAFGVVFASLGVFFFVVSFLLNKITLKKATRIPEVSNEYVFLPENFEITTYSKGNNAGKTTLPYSSIVRIVENKNYLYLYIDKVQAIIVDCNNFKEITDREVVKKYIEDNMIKTYKI